MSLFKHQQGIQHEPMHTRTGISSAAAIQQIADSRPQTALTLLWQFLATCYLRGRMDIGSSNYRMPGIQLNAVTYRG